MKKLFILLSSVAMIFTMATTAFADEPTETFDVFEYKKVEDNTETPDVDESKDTGYYLGEEKVSENLDYLELTESERGKMYPYVNEETNEANIGTMIDIFVKALKGEKVKTMDPELTYSYLIEWEDMVFTYDYNNAQVTRVWDAKTKSYKVDGTQEEKDKIIGWNKKTADISIESHCVQTIYDDADMLANAMICLSKTSNLYDENNEFDTILNDSKNGVKLSLVSKDGVTNEEAIDEIWDKVYVNNFINMMEQCFPNADFAGKTLGEIFTKDSVEELYNSNAAIRSTWSTIKYFTDDIDGYISQAYGENAKATVTYNQVRGEAAGKSVIISEGKAFAALFTPAQGANEYAKVTFSVNVGDGNNENKKGNEPAGDCQLHYYAVVTVGL